MFRTELKPPALPLFDLTHQTPVLTLGSCFAENMAARLQSLQFPILSNPFGIIYNPISIADCLNYLMINDSFSEENLFFHNHLWHSWRHHGRFSHSDKNILLNNVNQTLEAAGLFLKQTKWLVLTLGTAHVYVEKTSNRVVANCHKAPPQYFEKKRLETRGYFLKNFEKNFLKKFLYKILTVK
ncbi:MAG: GSCFA domain-containing protein [Saprospiraceae bacterium]|nr:GSCFA domain-containing protein [Saprospiraceae bacterium]